jgi:hypothetical protein
MTEARTLAFVAAVVLVAACSASSVAPVARADGAERNRPCQEIALQCYHRRAPSGALSRCRELAYEADVTRCRGHLAECLQACRASTDELEVVVPVPDGAKR